MPNKQGHRRFGNIRKLPGSDDLTAFRRSITVVVDAITELRLGRV